MSGAVSDLAGSRVDGRGSVTLSSHRAGLRQCDAGRRLAGCRRRRTEITVLTYHSSRDYSASSGAGVGTRHSVHSDSPHQTKGAESWQTGIHDYGHRATYLRDCGSVCPLDAQTPGKYYGFASQAQALAI